MNATDEQGSLALQRLEDQVAVVANRRDELDADLRERDDLIRAALQQGHSSRMVEVASGLSRGQVDAIRKGQRRR